MAHRGYKKKSGLHFLSLPIVTILIVMAGGTCQNLNQGVPLNAESVITPANLYESPEDKNRVTTYQHNLQNIFNNVRAHYKPRQLEFFIISGIGFRTIRINKAYDTYLSLNTKSSLQFPDSNTTFEQRVSTAFKRYIKPLLKIAAKERVILADSAIAGIAITARWKVKKILKEKHHVIVFEQVSLVTQKEQIENYLSARITDQELLDQSTLFSSNEGESLKIIKLHLE